MRYWLVAVEDSRPHDGEDIEAELSAVLGQAVKTTEVHRCAIPGVAAELGTFYMGPGSGPGIVQPDGTVMRSDG